MPPSPSSRQTLTLTQYQEAFIAAAVDGAFLYDLNDDDLKSSLGVEHRLHRKKILNSINRLKAAEKERVRPAALNSVSTPRSACHRQVARKRGVPNRRHLASCLAARSASRKAAPSDRRRSIRSGVV